MKLIEYENDAALYDGLAGVLADELRTALAAQGRVLFVVPGGTSPGPVFDRLAQADLDWPRVHVMLSDERWVPPDHARSNTSLIRARLMTGRAAAAREVPLYADAATPEMVIDRLIEGVEAHLPVSVCLLGMGADMHTASLFPGADKLAEALAPDAPALLPMRAPGAEEPRITLSARVLAAGRRHFLITGAEKRAALERAQGRTAMEAPVAALLDGATVHWKE